MTPLLVPRSDLLGKLIRINIPSFNYLWTRNKRINLVNFTFTYRFNQTSEERYERWNISSQIDFTIQLLFAQKNGESRLPDMILSRIICTWRSRSGLVCSCQKPTTCPNSCTTIPNLSQFFPILIACGPFPLFPTNEQHLER